MATRGCTCASPATGCVSGSVNVDVHCGCGARFDVIHGSPEYLRPDHSRPYCYVLDPAACAGSEPSRWFIGAAYRDCNPVPLPPPVSSPPRPSPPANRLGVENLWLPPAALALMGCLCAVQFVWRRHRQRSRGIMGGGMGAPRDSAADALQLAEKAAEQLAERRLVEQLVALPTLTWGAAEMDIRDDGAAVAFHAFSSGGGACSLGGACGSGGPPAFARASSGKSEGGEECSLCLEAYRKGQRVRRLPRGHAFHFACVDRWFMGPLQRGKTRQCPLCKANPLLESVGSVHSGGNSSAADTPQPAQARSRPGRRSGNVSLDVVPAGGAGPSGSSGCAADMSDAQAESVA